MQRGQTFASRTMRVPLPPGSQFASLGLYLLDPGLRFVPLSPKRLVFGEEFQEALRPVAHQEVTNDAVFVVAVAALGVDARRLVIVAVDAKEVLASLLGEARGDEAPPIDVASSRPFSGLFARLLIGGFQLREFFGVSFAAIAMDPYERVSVIDVESVDALALLHDEKRLVGDAIVLRAKPFANRDESLSQRL